MTLNNLKYYLTQSCKSVVRNGLMSFTSVFTVVCCLVILGIFLTMSINVTYIADQVQNQCEIQAFIDEKASGDMVKSIGAEIKNLYNVHEVVLFTKQDALTYMRELFGENASALDGYEQDNPFRDSYKITLKDLSLSADVIAAVGAIDGVAKVENRQSLMDTVFQITSKVKQASLWIMIVLGIVAVFIIANTIKLAVFSRRKEINIMKFVGATDWFIRWPFIIEGMIIGFIGSLIAFALISGGYQMLVSSLSGYNLDMIFQLKGYHEIWLQMLLIFWALGVFIGATGSFLSIRKHLQV